MGDRFADEINAVLEAVPNFRAATQAMQLSPQEQNLYKHHLMQLGNGGVPHPNGDLSTILQLGVEGSNGKQYNIPSVYDNQILPLQAAIQRAIQNGIDNMPSYSTVDQAERRYQQMHDFMDRDVGIAKGLTNGR